jgi:hypothetical protein
MNKKIAAALLTLALLVPLAGHAQGVYRSNNTSNVISSERVYLGVKYGEVSLEVDSDDGDREKAAISTITWRWSSSTPKPCRQKS